MPVTLSSHCGTLGRIAAAETAGMTATAGEPAASGDRAIRALAGGVVLAVAAFAAIVSYSHIYDLGRAHGQAGTAARLLPLSVDGLIVAASLVMLLEARAGRSAPPLARVMLGLGVAATIAANVAFGAAYGLTGAVISAWPAVAFIGAAELLLTNIRRIRPVPATTNTQVAVPAISARADEVVLVPEATRIQAYQAFAAEVSAGRTPSIRRRQRRWRRAAQGSGRRTRERRWP
jgi:hypothetical protein